MNILLVYLDDIIVFCRSFEEHIDRAMTRLSKHGLKLKAEKCVLLKTEVHFLGHVISGDGVKTDPEKICVVKEWSPPTTLKGLRKFLGFTSYYRRFVPQLCKTGCALAPTSWRISR